MQVFNGKKTNNQLALSKPWVYLGICTLALCLRFNTKQGFKGAEFLNLQRISFLGGFTCKTILDEATEARHQNMLWNGYHVFHVYNVY